MWGLLIGSLMASLVFWSLTDFSSPLVRRIFDDELLGITFAALNWPGFIFGIVVSGNGHGGYVVWNCVGVFLQWTALGYFFLWLREKLRNKLVAKNDV